MDSSADFSKRDTTSEGSEGSSIRDLSEILDLNEFDLESEDTWLYKPECKSDTNYKEWLYEETDTFEGVPKAFSSKNLKSKNFDTRTFTRPKRKNSRPSLDYYGQMYSSDSDGTFSAEVSKSLTTSFTKRLSENALTEESEEVPEPYIKPNIIQKPLHFDLSQPAAMHNFDSFMINSADLDSFQNMSPPSLVNSMCSSTFANLMENSFIKNDPILREIRDTDFTETALLQDIEAPMFQSITESCSSINSDSPESFLKRVARSNNNSFRKGTSQNSTLIQENSLENVNKNNISLNEDPNATFEVLNVHSRSISSTENASLLYNPTNMFHKEKTPEKIIKDVGNISLGDLKDTENVSPNIKNGTYRRTPKLQHNNTFRKADLKNNRLSLNLTFQRSKEDSLDKVSSRSIEDDLSKGSIENLSINRTKQNNILDNSIEDIKKRLSTTETDLNRLSYCMEEKSNQRNSLYKEQMDLNTTVDIKSRSNLGSADSLDRMSSLSSSSKGSNKMLNMAELDAIVAMQERSLNQAMSTPKPNIRTKNMWENQFISPIVSNSACSDSELSSDDYRSVRSTLSSKVSLESLKHPAKSLSNLAVPLGNDLKLKTSPRNAYTVSNQIRGSYTNLKTITNSNIGGSHTNLYRPSNLIRPPSQTNLKSIGTKLKGSYTSLRPISANLPVAPPVSSNLNSTVNLSRATHANVTQLVVNEPSKVISSGDNTFVKPLQPKAVTGLQSKSSGLPRPTGIPRPASRIPGPRSTNIRPTSTRSSSNY